MGIGISTPIKNYDPRQGGAYVPQTQPTGRAPEWSRYLAYGGAGALLGGPLGAGIGISAASAEGQQNASEDAIKREVDHGERQEELQREFAKYGIRWKVEDARQAGISPLAALGATTNAYQPTQLTTNDRSGWSDAGQNIAQIMFQSYLQNAQLTSEGTQLDNELKQAQIGKIRAETEALGHASVNPLGVNIADKKIDAIWSPISYANGEPRIQLQMSEELSQRMENDTLGRLQFGVDRAFGLSRPPESKLPKGYHYWEKSNMGGVWTAKKRIPRADKPEGVINRIRQKLGLEYKRPKVGPY